MVARLPSRCSAQIAGLEHVYLGVKPGLAVITVQFKVGVPRTEALVRLYDTITRTATGCPPDWASASRSSSPRASTMCRS